MDRRQMKKVILYAALNIYEINLQNKHKEGREYQIAMDLDLDPDKDLTSATESRYMSVLSELAQNAYEKLDA